MNKGKELNGKRIAILVTDGFEQVELTGPDEALQAAGAVTKIVSPAKGRVQGWNHFEKGDRFTVDVPLAEALRSIARWSRSSPKPSTGRSKRSLPQGEELPRRLLKFSGGSVEDYAICCSDRVTSPSC